jgi:hypothetical protein
VEEHVEPVEEGEPPAESATERAALSSPGGVVPVAYLTTPLAAHMVKFILEAGGVQAAVVGEHTAGLLAPLGPVVAVTVMVARDDYDAAVGVLTREILEPKSSTKNPRLPNCPACGYDLSGLESQGTCPECGCDIRGFADLRRLITIAPPPTGGGALLKAGAIMGVLILMGVVVLILVFVFGGYWLAKP